MNYYLLFALIFLAGGFALINKFGQSARLNWPLRWSTELTNRLVPEPVQVGSTVVTQKSLYLTLFLIGEIGLKP
jgi:hypothetical protein